MHDVILVTNSLSCRSGNPWRIRTGGICCRGLRTGQTARPPSSRRRLVASSAGPPLSSKPRFHFVNDARLGMNLLPTLVGLRRRASTDLSAPLPLHWEPQGRSMSRGLRLSSSILSPQWSYGRRSHLLEGHSLADVSGWRFWCESDVATAKPAVSGIGSGPVSSDCRLRQVARICRPLWERDVHRLRASAHDIPGVVGSENHSN